MNIRAERSRATQSLFYPENSAVHIYRRQKTKIIGLRIVLILIFWTNLIYDGVLQQINTNSVSSQEILIVECIVVITKAALLNMIDICSQNSTFRRSMSSLSGQMLLSSVKMHEIEWIHIKDQSSRVRE
jgi:hypothetical protein